jgi:hypothetical protein
MRIHAPQVTQNRQVQGAAFEPSGLCGLQTAKVPPPRRAFHGVQSPLGVQQTLRRPRVLRHESGCGQLEIFEHKAVESTKVGLVLLLAAQVVAKLLGLIKAKVESGR